MFECADPDLQCTAEIEQFIRNDLWQWATEPGAQDDDPRLLTVVEDESGELIAVGAHELRTAQTAAGTTQQIRWIQVIAVAATYQGRRIQSGYSFGDVAMSALLSDVTERSGEGTVVMSRVHVENRRSLALLARHQFTQTRSVPGTPYLDVF